MEDNGMTKSIGVAFTAVALTLCLVPTRASAAIVGFTGTGGFVAVGGIGNVGGGCFPVACDSGFVPFDTIALLADGMRVSGFVRQIVQEDIAGNTVSALLRVTNIIATNNGAGLANDTFFVVSDIFNPSLAGNAGVGIAGSFQSLAGVGGPVTASTQAQMNYLSTPINALGGPVVSFALTTVSPFANCVFCSPIPFFAAAFVNNAPGGIEQLVGAINFTAGPGSQIVLPGSLILEDNNSAAITDEAPEPATLLLMGGMLAGLGATRKLRRG
jgi:hypothetical protein